MGSKLKSSIYFHISQLLYLIELKLTHNRWNLELRIEELVTTKENKLGTLREVKRSRRLPSPLQRLASECAPFRLFTQTTMSTETMSHWKVLRARAEFQHESFWQPGGPVPKVTHLTLQPLWWSTRWLCPHAEQGVAEPTLGPAAGTTPQCTEEATLRQGGSGGRGCPFRVSTRWLP